jgi:hypothetical protein
MFAFLFDVELHNVGLRHLILGKGVDSNTVDVVVVVYFDFGRSFINTDNWFWAVA